MPTPHVCGRCGRCCQVTPGEEDLFFPLSDNEISAIEAVSNELKFATRQKNTARFLQNMATLFPDCAPALAKAFPEDGEHWRLTVKNGRCLFLDEDGCRLTPAIRPMHCRLFPLWIVNGQVALMDEDCLAGQEAEEMGQLFNALGLSVQQVAWYYAGIRRLWNL